MLNFGWIDLFNLFLKINASFNSVFVDPLTKPPSPSSNSSNLPLKSNDSTPLPSSSITHCLWLIWLLNSLLIITRLTQVATTPSSSTFATFHLSDPWKNSSSLLKQTTKQWLVMEYWSSTSTQRHSTTNSFISNIVQEFIVNKSCISYHSVWSNPPRQLHPRK